MLPALHPVSFQLSVTPLSHHSYSLLALAILMSELRVSLEGATGTAAPPAPGPRHHLTTSVSPRVLSPSISLTVGETRHAFSIPSRPLSSTLHSTAEKQKHSSHQISLLSSAIPGHPKVFFLKGLIFG